MRKLITFNPFSIFGKAPNDFEVKGELRPVDGQGPFTSAFNNYVPRKVDADFYESLREAIPLIDAAIWKLTDLDGHLIVEGDNDRLVDEIKDWMDNVPVCDVQTGLQSFHQNITNETFEQGFGIGEFLPDNKRTDIVHLKVADSKSIRFKRAVKSMNILQKSDEDREYRVLKPNNLIYQSHHNENMNPYGTSVMRPMPFCGKILATMHNSLLKTWGRFGDPSFHVDYKTSKKGLGNDTLEARRQKISAEFKGAIKNKADGYAEDFVTAVDNDSSFGIKIIGHDGQVLEIEEPARHVVEQILAATGLPSWMLGLHWSTTERLADKEVTMLNEARTTRHLSKLPVYTNLIKTLLLLRGRTWKKGDWCLKFEKLNLHDIEQEARARFLNLQGDYYLVQNAATMGIQINPAQLSNPEAYKSAEHNPTHSPLKQKGDATTCACSKSHKHQGCKELFRPVPWPELDEQEQGYEKTLKYDWDEFRQRIFILLGLETPDETGRLTAAFDKGEGDLFRFTDEQRAAIMQALENFTGEYKPSNPDSAVTWYYGRAYSLGTIQAAKLVGSEQPILNILKNTEVMEELYKNGFSLLKNSATKRIINKILPEIDGMVMAGTNPVHIASRLKKLFGDANSDWERLARTELSICAEQAKVDEWSERDIDTDNARIPGKDTHPRCRCANTVQKIGDTWVVKFVPAPDACASCMALAGEV